MSKTHSSLNGLFVALICPRGDADDQNPVSLRHEFGRLWICHFHLFGRRLKQSRQFRAPAVRAGQRPVFARNDPLDIFGDQRQQISLIGAAHRCEEILHNLNILFDAHRISPFSLRRIASDLIGANSDGREAAVDGQLHPIHEARIV